MKHWRSSLAIITALVTLAATTAAAVGYYPSSEAIKTGMLVSASKNAGIIDPANTSNAGSLLGVVGPEAEDTPLSQQTDKTNVRVDGEVATLVSTANGDIKVGDRIAPSALQGIGAKSIKNGWIVGVAQASFDAKTSGAVQSSVSNSSGSKQDVYVGTIPVVVHVAYYNPKTGTTTTAVPEKNTLQSLADKIAGKRASELGILLSFIILFVGLVIVGLSVNSIIKGGFLAISRQPLIRGYLLKTIAQSFAIVGVILVAVFVAAFMLLRIL